MLPLGDPPILPPPLFPSFLFYFPPIHYCPTDVFLPCFLTSPPHPFSLYPFIVLPPAALSVCLWVGLPLSMILSLTSENSLPGLLCFLALPFGSEPNCWAPVGVPYMLILDSCHSSRSFLSEDRVFSYFEFLYTFFCVCGLY